MIETLSSFNPQVNQANFMAQAQDVSGAKTLQQTCQINGFEGTVSNDDADRASKIDDEAMSGLESEKKTKKEKAKEAKEKAVAALNIAKAAEIYNAQGSAQQDSRMKRIAKEKAIQFANMAESRSEQNIGERSGRLFKGSEDAYKEAFEAINALDTEKTSAKELLNQVSSRFPDVAEQHNALEIVRQTWNDEITLLAGGKLEDPVGSGKFTTQNGFLNEITEQIKELTNKGSLTDEEAKKLADLEDDRDLLTERLDDLQDKLAELDKASGHLMDTAGPRITDSYKLAPQFNKIQTEGKNEFIIPPKSMNALILDDLLGALNDKGKIFSKLVDGVLGDPSQKSYDESNKVERFHQNVEIVYTVLSNELNNLTSIQQLGDTQDVAKAVMDTLQSAREIKTTFELNKTMLEMSFKAFVQKAN